MRAPTELLNPDDVAWPFHPDHDAWVDHGFPSWTDARPWIEAHVPAPEAALFTGWAEPDEAAVWVQGGVSRREAGEWRDRGFTAAESVNWATRAGPRAAAVWRELGFSADDCRAWREHGFDAGHAFMWRDAGCSPNQSAAWSSAAVAVWRRQHAGEPTPDWAIRWYEEQTR